MYSYRNLGLNGRFGNQMFQYAALLAVSRLHSEECYIPDSINRSDFPLQGEYELLQAFPNLSANRVPYDDKLLQPGNRYHEPSFSFDPNLFIIRANTDLHGYFQSEQYFAHMKEDIKREFRFSDTVMEKCSKKHSELKKLGNLCSLHVRRTDYQSAPDYHTNLSTIQQYYSTAISAILKNDATTKFVIFSDDIEWCKSAFPADAIFPDMDNQYEDMCLMTLCDYHIIANSSFSWWGSWLSDSKMTIAPKRWFGPKGPPDWSSVYAKGWYVA